LRLQDRLDDAIAAAYADALAFGFLIQNDDKIKAPETTAALYRRLQTFITASARAQHLEPELLKLLDTAGKEISPTLQTFDGSNEALQGLRRAAFTAQATLARWVAQPEDVRKGKVTYEKLQGLGGPPASPSTAARDAKLDEGQPRERRSPARYLALARLSCPPRRRPKIRSRGRR
jgi:hypothetical protein